ncbi:MAG: penicillin acylase family protein [Gammaproteobacteria bacterium]
MSRVRRIGVWLGAGLSLAVLLSLLIAYLTLRGSLAELDGTVSVAGLAGPVTIERDGAGVPTLRAQARTDLFFAQGYLHAQERYFQMDLARRVAAGRLSELFGSRALDADRRARIHGLSVVADASIAALPQHQKDFLERYVAGVNAGLDGLGKRPFEYLLLRLHPAPWTLRDSVLVQLAMFLDLTDEEAQLDRQRGLMFDALPPAVYAWLTTPGSAWDAPLAGPAIEPPPMPERRWFSRADSTVAPQPSEEADRGSNSFAVSGALTPHGSAILANDMHLGLRVPNIWFRLRLMQDDGMQAVGVSLPGVPGIVVGSNTHIAWGFTNSYGDYSDRVVLRTSGSAGRYRVPLGGDTLRVREETIQIKDAEPVRLSVPMTRFGPVIAEDAQRRPVAVRWLAHFSEAVNLNLLDMLDVTEVDSAIALAQRLGIPPQNILLAGKDGRVAWTIAGRLPRRVGYDPSRPVLSDQDGGWRGWLRPSDYPVVRDPVAGRLWTANARVAPLANVALIGESNFPLGARASQIRDQLFARDQFDEAALLGIALDTRGVFLERWRTLLRAQLTPQVVAATPGRRALLEALSRGRLDAAADSSAYLLVRAFRERVEADVLGSFLAPLSGLPGLRIDRLRQREVALWQTVSQQPAHLVPLDATDWPSYFLSVVDQLVLDLPPAAAQTTWGARNTARIRHPLSSALPGFLRSRLDMPADPLPGDAWMPRVQGPAFGASQRLVVAPGHEERGLFHMPGGQSGHPLSPFYRRGHDDWVAGRESPLLPGPTRYTLRLEPGGSSTKH